MKGECFINGKDAQLTWGIVLGNTSFTTLLTPAPLKECVRNKSSIHDGVSVLCNESMRPMVDERNIQLIFYLKAKNMNEFLTRYSSFVAELEKGMINLSTKYQPGVVYHLLYMSCQQFTQFNGRLAKFVLKLNEPNPRNRA